MNQPETDQVFEVEKIIKERPGTDCTEYFVKWKGYSSKSNSWEPESNILDPELVQKYQEELSKSINLNSRKDRTEHLKNIEIPKTSIVRTRMGLISRTKHNEITAEKGKPNEPSSNDGFDKFEDSDEIQILDESDLEESVRNHSYSTSSYCWPFWTPPTLTA